jgi:hypothetical protein
MANQMLASVKGMSACTTPNEASASTTEASCGVSQQTRTCARTPIGRYLRLGVRHRLKRTADLDGEVDAAVDRRSAHYDVLDRREQPP